MTRYLRSNPQHGVAFKHGHTIGRPSPEYRVWCSMLTRCANPNVKGYKGYGGRGISVCDRWKTFSLFLQDMGPRPSLDHQIERKDVNGNYEPGNCIWLPKDKQASNRRNTVRLTLNGQTRLITEWAPIVGLSPFTIYDRIKRGYSASQCLFKRDPNVKWRPSHQELYWYIGDNGRAVSTEHDVYSKSHNHRIFIDNYFRTRRQAMRAAKAFKCFLASWKETNLRDTGGLQHGRGAALDVCLSLEGCAL